LAIKCPSCHSDNPETVKFCGECGTALPPSKDCPPVMTETLRTPVKELARGTVFGRRFEVIEELGKGGMGKVYRVFDRKIGEEVALKLIRPEIAAEREVIDRFSNELRLARKISHRNVGKMFEIMEDEGAHFITMEYVPGENLKSMIRMSGQLGVGTAVGIAKQVCEGLSEAHRLGIVHRDLKPSNIMIDREGAARIMDFGIARSVRGKGITGAGVMIGTPEYMSPEQVEGKEVDQRSDIYSLGVVLYEMLTGRVPFEGDTPFTVGVKHKSEVPRDPRELNSQIPDDLSGLVLRCLEKQKEKRYQSAEELRVDLEKIEQRMPTTQIISPQRKRFTSKEITVKFRLRNLLAPTVAVIAVGVIALVVWRFLPRKSARLIPGGKPSIAVLYFKNNTGDAKLDIWRSALSDSIITDLSQSRYVNVLSTDQLLSIHRKLGLLDARAYASEDVRRIAAEGRVNHVLQGSLSKAGDLFRIDYTLQDVVSGKNLGSSRVEGTGEVSMFAMVDELTRKIKQDLKLTGAEIAGDFDKSVGQITTNSPEAYKLYIEGSKYFFLGEFRRSIGYYEKAIAIDPEFATAYRSMAMAYSNLGYLAKSREYRKKAFEFSDHVSERERLRNEAEFYGMSDRTMDKQIEAFKRLLELYPDDRSGNVNLGTAYMELEEWDAAIERYQVCVRLKDESPAAYVNLALAYMGKGMPDEALKTIESYLSEFPDNLLIRTYAAFVYLCQGKIELAHAEIDRALSLAPKDFMSIAIKGMIYHCQGELIDAEKQYQSLLNHEEPMAQIWRYVSLANLRGLEGRIAEAQELLGQATELVQKAGEKDWECFFLSWSAYNQLLLGAPQKAMSSLDRLWPLASERGSDFTRLTALPLKGVASLRLKDPAAAQKAAEELKTLVDRSMYKKEIRGYYYLMGQIEMERKNFPKAIEYFGKAVSLMPEQWIFMYERHALYIDSLARAYFQTGNLEKAQAEFEKILSLTTGRLYFGDIYAKSYYMLGKIYEQKGLKAKARENFLRFLDLWKDADRGLPEVDDARARLARL
jgi:serine/threonine protein kinase/tetratricopeptide (TPR) repeat protein